MAIDPVVPIGVLRHVSGQGIFATHNVAYMRSGSSPRGLGGPVFTVAAVNYFLKFILPTGINISDLAKKGSRRLLGVGNDGVLFLLL
jgi:hypothetical protein